MEFTGAQKEIFDFSLFKESWKEIRFLKTLKEKQKKKDRKIVNNIQLCKKKFSFLSLQSFDLDCR